MTGRDRDQIIKVGGGGRDQRITVGPTVGVFVIVFVVDIC